MLTKGEYIKIRVNGNLICSYVKDVVDGKVLTTCNREIPMMDVYKYIPMPSDRAHEGCMKLVKEIPQIYEWLCAATDRFSIPVEVELTRDKSITIARDITLEVEMVDLPCIGCVRTIPGFLAYFIEPDGNNYEKIYAGNTAQDAVSAVLKYLINSEIDEFSKNLELVVE